MSGARVSIPNNVRKTIQNIKEITGNHSEDEIYAMLKECSMDPNETTQKLLLQDPFHEVKRKRDRKKENLNKEITEPKWKPGMQGRGNRGGRGNHPSRHISNDAVGGRTSFSAKENGINQGKKNKETFVVASSSSSKGPTIVLGSGTTRGSNATSASKIPSPSPGVGLSDSDPILMPSTDSPLLAGTIRREVGSQQPTVDQIHETPIEDKLNSSGKVPVEVQGIGKNLLLESSRVGPSSHVSVSISRPSSNYNNRHQQAIGPQKVGPTMEWKPKPTNPILTQDSESIESTKVPVIPIESQSQSQTPTLSASTNLDSNVLIKKLEDSHISDNQHVIIPNHLHVPEAEKLGFCFGSFDASFGLNLGSLNGPGPVSDKSSIASEVVDESIEDQQPRNQNASSTDDQGDDPDRPTSSNNIPENLSTENADSSNAGPHHQYPVVHTSPNFSFGFMPPMIGTHLNESQYPLVQQPIDPASYYAQFYRSGADADGRVSPFQLTGVPNKFNGNIPILPPQASQSSQEVVTNPTPITTSQTGGIMQTSIPVTQQPLPVFRQPTGVHLPHYPPNYIPYGPYFSPFYVPQPTIHQFLSNGGTFSLHPQTGYSGPPVANPKYPVPQYKSAGHYGSNPGSGTTAANLGSNEDHGGSRFNESNVYITGQQSEGSGVWVGPPGRDISGLQPNSFYNMGQAGHGPFPNIYHHPAQPVTTGAVHPLLQQHSQPLGGPGSDMAGPTPQVNWPNNY